MAHGSCLTHRPCCQNLSADVSCDLQIGSEGFQAAVSSMQLPMLVAKSLLHMAISAAMILSPDTVTVKACLSLQPALPHSSAIMEVEDPSYGVHRESRAEEQSKN